MESSTLREAEEKVLDMNRRLEGKGKKRIQYAIPGRIYMDRSEVDAKKRVEKLVGSDSKLLKEILTRDFVGSPQDIADRLQQLSEIGFDYVIFSPSPALKTLHEIEEKLIPIL
jgi:alkanesulfonate monooxygenase SsuD/methylene tetrahydromethanopterin reductase-like flavin-dependent oxidoreductase (luciferase family)